jgi:DNA-binding PadR family transcriptional regulator
VGKVADFFRDQSVPLGQQQKAKMLSLDREFVELESKVRILEADNLKLRAEVNPLKKEVGRLENKVQQKDAPLAHNPDETEIEVMKFIGDKRSTTASDIQSGLKIHSVVTEHCLGRLLKSDFIEQSRVPLVGAMYSLTNRGNAYLVEKKLVQLPNLEARQPNNPKGHHCDHCGSAKLRRTGSKPDPTFGDVGIKQALYTCIDCGKESGFTDDR